MKLIFLNIHLYVISSSKEVPMFRFSLRSQCQVTQECYENEENKPPIRRADGDFKP